VQVTVGRIGKPHGIRGEVTIEVRTDEPELRFAPGTTLKRESGSDLIVSDFHWHSGRVLLKFLGVDSRSAAEELRNSILTVERTEDEVPSENDEYYDSNLIGCQVKTLAGEAIGHVIDVLHLPSQEVLVVRTDGDAGTEYLIPFVESIVPTVDVVSKIITVDPPDGLLTEDIASED
jgi:16S rRNA processing protein RimM